MQSKRLIWTFVAMAASATASALALKAVHVAWTRITGEEPPEAPKWARLLSGIPARRLATRLVQPPPKTWAARP